MPDRRILIFLIPVILVVLAIAAILLLVGSNTISLPSSLSSIRPLQLDRNQFRFEITDNHPSLKVEPNPQFNVKELSDQISNIRTEKSMKGVKINFTQTPTSKIRSELTNGTKINYVGSNLKQEGETLLIDLYINSEAIGLLQKSDEELLLDVLQEMFVGLKEFELNQAANGLRTQSEYSAAVTQTYQEGAERAQSLIDSNNIPFTIQKQ